MKKSLTEQLLQDRELHGLSIRRLAHKYGMSSSRVHRMVSKKKKMPSSGLQPVEENELPDDIALLKAMLRKEKLKNELLTNIIDIASKELGVDIRKKSGARQSE